MEQELISAILDIVVVLVYVGILFIVNRGHKFLEKRVSAEQGEVLDAFIAKMVAAADQMFKKDDPDGTVRMKYVQDMLIKAGYEITDIVKATIESKVHDLNIMQKAVKE